MKLNRHERCVLRALAADLHDCPGDVARRLAPCRTWWTHLVRATALLAPYGCGTVYQSWPAGHDAAPSQVSSPAAR